MNSSHSLKSTVQTSIRIVTQGKAAVVSFLIPCVSDTDQICLASQEIGRFIEEHHPLGMVFDFSQVKFFSSQVLGLILEARVHLQPYHGHVVVSSIDPSLYRVFRITNLDRIIKFFPSCNEALASDLLH